LKLGNKEVISVKDFGFMFYESTRISFSYHFIFETSRLYTQNMISGRNEGGGMD